MMVVTKKMLPLHRVASKKQGGGERMRKKLNKPY